MYTVPEYLDMLRLAKRSEGTINHYTGVFRSYSRFLEVPLDKIHNHISPENLIKYAKTRSKMSEAGTQVHLSVLHRYFAINGVSFDPLELNVLKARRREDRDDKPLCLKTLQQMMDLGTPHTRAILSTLISTGMRAGECCQILLSDVNGDILHIRPEIAKQRRGGNVYLSAEAREYIDIWLKGRPNYLIMGEKRHRGLVVSGHSKARNKNDKRLFACSYPTMRWLFTRLYNLVDGEQGKYRAKCTLHSTRKYFRTHAVKTMELDVVEKIMRHSGYLTDSYVRISDDETRKAFHAGEQALYITRQDQRRAESEVDQLKKELEREKERAENMERYIEVSVKKYINEVVSKG